MKNDSRIALLIDADNAPAKSIDYILSKLANAGKVTIRLRFHTAGNKNTLGRS